MERILCDILQGSTLIAVNIELLLQKFSGSSDSQPKMLQGTVGESCVLLVGEEYSIIAADGRSGRIQVFQITSSGVSHFVFTTDFVQA